VTTDGLAAYADVSLEAAGASWKPDPVPLVRSLNGGIKVGVDVTAFVAQHREGPYTFTSHGGFTSIDRDLAGGWSLVVVTREASEPQRVLIVLDGLVTYSAGADLALPLGGLGAAGGGSRAAHVGAVAWDGDRGSATDSMVLVVGGARRPICDSLHPADDVMDSVVSVGGAFGDPAMTNTLGFDAWLVDVDLDTTTCPAVGGLGLATVAAPAGSLSLDLSASEQIWLGAITLAVPT
jgi:hypothetical protein